jgi:hypothetical protein
MIKTEKQNILVTNKHICSNNFRMDRSMSKNWSLEMKKTTNYSVRYKFHLRIALKLNQKKKKKYSKPNCTLRFSYIEMRLRNYKKLTKFWMRKSFRLKKLLVLLISLLKKKKIKAKDHLKRPQSSLVIS